MLRSFDEFMEQEGKSKNTIKSYKLQVKEYLDWFQKSYGCNFIKLHRENVLEYKSYLSNIKKYKGNKLKGKTINAKISALLSFNKFLIKEKRQSNLVIKKNDMLKIQTSYVNPAEISKIDVENFRQKILEADNKRLYAIVTLIAYSGLRITEALNIKLDDINLITQELIVTKAKGNKSRVLFLNSKVVNSIKAYMKTRDSNSNYLFASRQSPRVDRSVINKQFKKYSKVITPHKLRHFFCSNALDSGFAIHEVANLAGHKSIQTTLIYTNPSKENMKSKLESL
ncbi:transposase [Senegalia massiliensis]|uniref:Transposase n=1 Tax=Senegalia massiliensis TaxID=1720316 RepID=A0A845QY83_9CLOT|nr:transposase [Senegalia massiliensis]